jgi:hypothetical protein
MLYTISGAVTNTLIALTSQCMSSLQLQSKYADHLSAEAIQLHHRGTVYEVAPGTGKNAYHCGYYFLSLLVSLFIIILY